jgi:uncharacterized protein
MKKSLLLFFLFCMATTWVLAQPPIPEPMGRWVVDDANILSEATEKTVSTLCFKEYQSSSNQIMVYTFTSLQGGTIESYANEVYNKWEIGTKDNNNGVLLIIAVDDHKMRIEVGYGLESYLTDLESKDIINNEIKPRFKEGDFDNGVMNGVQNIIYGIKNSYVASSDNTTSSYKNSPPIGLPFFIIGAIWLALAVFSSRMQLAEGIMAMVFFGIFLISFAIIFLAFMHLAIIIVIGLVVTVVLNKIWKPKKPIKFFTGSSGGGSWSGSSGSSWGSSYNSSSSSSYSSGSDYGGFSGGGGSSGGGGASGDW